MAKLFVGLGGRRSSRAGGHGHRSRAGLPARRALPLPLSRQRLHGPTAGTGRGTMAAPRGCPGHRTHRHGPAHRGFRFLSAYSTKAGSRARCWKTALPGPQETSQPWLQQRLLLPRPLRLRRLRTRCRKGASQLKAVSSVLSQGAFLPTSMACPCAGTSGCQLGQGITAPWREQQQSHARIPCPLLRKLEV